MKLHCMLQKLAATLISLYLTSEPVAANAGGAGLVIDPAAAQKASVGQALNGVATINIVAPNAAGLSHNKFSEYNVAPSGVILNNARHDGISQLGGALLANPNLDGKSSASTILTEVTSASRSRLEGFTEVFSNSADFILANPNGITCNGCGFTGTPRVVLTTGAPQFNPQGGISGFAVDGGDIAAAGNGLNASGIDVLDLISRSVTVNGQVNGKSVNVVAGRNDVAYADRAVTARAADPTSAPLYAIDSTALGGMYANRISLVAIEQGVGVNMQGDMAANAGELQITADGGLILCKASATRDMTLASTNGDVTVREQAVSNGALHASAGDIIATDASLHADGDLTLTARRDLTATQAKLTTEASATLTAVRTLDLTGSTLESARNIALNAATAQLNGSLQAGQDLTLTATTATLAEGTVAAGRDLGITTATAQLNGSLQAGQDLTLTATTATLAEGTVAAGRDLGITTATVRNSGKIRALGDMTLTVASLLENSGGILARQHLKIVSPGVLTNDGGDIIGGMGLTIDDKANGTIGQVENISGTIQAGLGNGTVADMSITAKQVTNRKKAFAFTTRNERAVGEDTLDVDSWGANESCHSFVSYDIQEITTDSTVPSILADGAMTLKGETIANDQGVFYAYDDMTVQAESLTNSVAQLSVTKVVTKVMRWNQKRCIWRKCKDWRWNIQTVDRKVKSSRDIFGRIDAAGKLALQVVENLANVGVESDSPLYTIAAGSVEDAINGIAFALLGNAASGALTHLPPRDANGLYTRTKSPDAAYLVETNPILSNLNNVYGSSYFLNLAGIDTNDIAKRLGDDGYETKVVRDAIFAETGKRYLSNDITSDAAQMQKLMDAALAERTALDLSFGVSLSAEQIAALTHDIVWFEEVEIDGEIVLAPHLYLAQMTTDNIDPRSTQIVATSANIQAAQVANSGLISPPTAP